MDNYSNDLKNNISNSKNNDNINNSSSLTEINLEESINQNKNEEILRDIVDNFLQKKLSKENELKSQIERNKKNILEKFYSLSNNNFMNQDKENEIKDSEYNFSEQKNNIPEINQGQKEYEEIKEKYKNERNKKKSSIFKSEDLRISNTNIVHIKKDDYSPINPNVVDIENKNNIIIIQKKLFGENEDNDELEGMGTGKIEDIDEIELDFSEINNNKYEESEIIYNNTNKSNNNNKNTNTNSEKNKENKNHIDEEINSNFFKNEILLKKREIDLCFIANSNLKNNTSNGINRYNKQKQRYKNYSVQLVSSIGYLNKNSNINGLNIKRKNNNSISNNINNFNFYGQENKENNFILNYLRNNKCNRDQIMDNNYINGKIINNYDNSENDISNNTIVQINNNNKNNSNINYNGKYFINNKLINGSSTTQNYMYPKNNILDNKYRINEYRNLNNKKSYTKSNLYYIDYKNLSGKFNQKTLGRVNANTSNYVERNLKKPKAFPIKKKNNSLILNRDNNIINNKIINKSMYQTLNNMNKNSLVNNNNYNTHTHKNLLNYNNNINMNGNVNNKIIPIISQVPITNKLKKNVLPKITIKNQMKNNNKKIGNKISIINTLLNNNLLLFQKEHHQHEAIEKLKSRPNNGIYFIYVDKVNEGYSFKGIYKRGPSEINHICNKIYGILNAPLTLSYENFYILVENEDKKFEFKKLRDISHLSFFKTILLIKNK